MFVRCVSCTPVWLCAFLNGWTDFDEIFCVFLSGTWDDLDSQLDQVDPTRRGAPTRIFRFTMEMFVYKLLPLANQVKAGIKLNF